MSQPNIFMLYMPPTNMEALVHYEDTIKKGVSLERIAKYLPVELRNQLRELFGNKPIAVWGSRDTPVNHRKFDQMAIRDDILIVEGAKIRTLGLVAGKIVSPELSRELWQNLRGDVTKGWDLIYFIANAKEINLEFTAFNKLFGYKESYQLQGFTVVAQEKLEAFYDQYDDLYDVLMRAKDGLAIEKKNNDGVLPLDNPVAGDSAVEVTKDDVDQILDSELVSDHLKMQWKLVRLGMKAGEKVWVPVGDQRRVRNYDETVELESRFTTGIDLPANYYENIDVIWKEQFRIDAAFEIENSTAIYSGLLRFSDLNIVAPNTVYPLFIVAPAARRGQVREQLCRHTFRRLRLDSKVRFLPYETIDEIDRFFSNSNSGLSIELLHGKAEKLECVSSS